MWTVKFKQGLTYINSNFCRNWNCLQFLSASPHPVYHILTSLISCPWVPCPCPHIPMSPFPCPTPIFIHSQTTTEKAASKTAMTYLLVLNELYDIYSNSLIGHTYFNPNMLCNDKWSISNSISKWTVSSTLYVCAVYRLYVPGQLDFHLQRMCLSDPH